MKEYCSLACPLPSAQLALLLRDGTAHSRYINAAQTCQLVYMIKAVPQLRLLKITLSCVGLTANAN